MAAKATGASALLQVGGWVVGHGGGGGGGGGGSFFGWLRRSTAHFNYLIQFN
jgi:hypothetical protein